MEFPQAFRQMLPIIVAQLVVLLKDTSLGYIVGYPELLRVTMNNLSSFFGNRYLFSFFVVTLVLYLVDEPVTIVVRALVVEAHREPVAGKRLDPATRTRRSSWPRRQRPLGRPGTARGRLGRRRPNGRVGLSNLVVRVRAP